MKRVVSASIITLLIIVAVAATFYYLKNVRSQGGNPVIAIPSDAAFLIVFDPASGKLSDFLSMEMWPLMQKSPDILKFQKHLKFIDSTFNAHDGLKGFFKNQPLYITGHVTGADKFDFLFLKSVGNGFNEKSTDDLIKSIAGEDKIPVKRNYDGNIIREISMSDGRIFSYVSAKGILVASFTSFLVEDALRQLKVGKPGISNSMLASPDKNKDESALYINFKNLPAFTGLFSELNNSQGLENLKSYASWAVAEMDARNHKIHFNGFITATDSTQFITCFENQQSVEKNLIKILPRKTAVINYTGVSNFQEFYSRFKNRNFSVKQKTDKEKLFKSISAEYKIKIEEKMLSWIGNEFALIITEPGGTSYDKNSFAIIKAKNIIQAKKLLVGISSTIDKKNNSATMEEPYNGHGIGFINLSNVIPSLLGETFSRVSKMYYTDIEDYIVFANQASSIRSYIDEYKSGLLLYKTDFYEDASKSFPAKGNHFFFTRPALASQIFKSNANNTWKKYVDQYPEIIQSISAFGYQLNGGDSLVTITAAVNFLTHKSTEGVDKIFGIETDTVVLMKPLISTDPVTKTKQIVFQDEASNFYLVDNSGNIIWKQPVDGKIIGEIFEIDLFKNNSRQFLFNTAQYLYMLDAKGSPVGNYPIRLPAAASNGIAVFDFDKNKDFKIYVACENLGIYAYQPSGKPLPGWNYLKSSELVTDRIQSIEINNKNILVVKDLTGALQLINRFGESVVNFISPVRQAVNSKIFKTPGGNLVTSDINGSLIEISANGNLQQRQIDSLSPNHGFLYADADGNKISDYIFLDGKKLVAYDSELTLLYSKTFESNMTGDIQMATLKSGNIVMIIRSSDADKTWMLKMDGTIYSGFPVKGSSASVMDELNMDGNKHLIIAGKENLLHVYSVE